MACQTRQQWHVKRGSNGMSNEATMAHQTRQQWHVKRGSNGTSNEATMACQTRQQWHIKRGSNGTSNEAAITYQTRHRLGVESSEGATTAHLRRQLQWRLRREALATDCFVFDANQCGVAEMGIMFVIIVTRKQRHSMRWRRRSRRLRTSWILLLSTQAPPTEHRAFLAAWTRCQPRMHEHLFAAEQSRLTKNGSVRADNNMPTLNAPRDFSHTNRRALSSRAACASRFLCINCNMCAIVRNNLFKKIKQKLRRQDNAPV